MVSRHVTRVFYKLDGTGFLPKERWHLWTIDAETGEGQQLTNGDVFDEIEPAWSPDGEKIVFRSNQADNPDLEPEAVDLLVVSATGGAARKIEAPAGPKQKPVFSPDGKQVCYSSTLGGSYQIWHLPSLGSIALQLTKTQAPYSDALTVWSPDGRNVVFYSNRSGSWDIWSVDLAGRGEPKQLTHFESNENYPAWSPDGKNISFRTD